MKTFRELLRAKHHYLPSDFLSEDGEVSIDSNHGTVHPIGADGKTVPLEQVLAAGQYVSLDLEGGGVNRLRFVVISVNHDGITAVSAQGEEGFLPWQLLAGALRKSRKVYVDVLCELEELDDQDRAFVHEEILRLGREIRHQRAALADLNDQLDRLESIGHRPTNSPTSWLQAE